MPGTEAIQQVQSAPRGRVRGHHVHEPSFREQVQAMCRTWPRNAQLPRWWKPLTGFKPNLILREWGAIVGRLLLREGTKFGISGMYIEFANDASPVSPPSYDRGPDSGVEYYNSLSDDATLDYLRVQLVAGVLNVSDDTLYPKGNQPTFFAMTGGTTGVHGKAFSEVANSRVIGAALVATPEADDATQDLVLSRFYFDEADQIPKLATGQVGIEWQLTLQ